MPRQRITTSAADDVRGLYGPGSEAWALNREAMLLLGAGPRALLLQLAHPAVAAGVADHSDFRADPWRRLQGTLRSYLTIVYGTGTAARAEIRRLNGLHRTITGPTYQARDPELSLWVHATLVDSTIVVADRWLEPLSRERRRRYYAETLPIGRAFGIPDAILPPDLAAFEAYVEEAIGPRGPVHPGELARELADAVLHPPLGPVLPALEGIPARLYAWTLWPSLGLLPATIREAYGFAWAPLQRAISAWLVATWRWWRPRLPVELRQMPAALAADRRLAGMGDGPPVGGPSEPGR
ncbi:MAG TPA: oxygenase MpaB family protein [Candidatus Limnocylindrales bacterium]|nr:oxygenase MpaB family protein [Candidatus Limnocylindrales bacterium]